MLTVSPMDVMEDETEEVMEDTALSGLAPLRKLEPNMPDDFASGSLGSCRNLDSKRLRDEGLRPGVGLPGGPWLKASTVRLLLRPVEPLEAPTCGERCWASASEGLEERKEKYCLIIKHLFCYNHSFVFALATLENLIHLKVHINSELMRWHNKTNRPDFKQQFTSAALATFINHWN